MWTISRPEDVELNSRAVTPVVRLTAPVTVKAGENARVSLQM
jgi:hypothetical protein